MDVPKTSGEHRRWCLHLVTGGHKATSACTRYWDSKTSAVEYITCHPYRATLPFFHFFSFLFHFSFINCFRPWIVFVFARSVTSLDRPCVSFATQTLLLLSLEVAINVNHHSDYSAITVHYMCSHTTSHQVLSKDDHGNFDKRNNLQLHAMHARQEE